jgi:GcrA cell cycle regulator
MSGVRSDVPLTGINQPVMSGLEPRRVRHELDNERVELSRSSGATDLSASQIAAELGGVTRNAVIGKVHRLGLSGRAKSGSSSAYAEARRAATARRLGTKAEAPQARQPQSIGATAAEGRRTAPVRRSCNRRATRPVADVVPISKRG